MKEMVYMWPPMEPQNTILDRGYIGEFEYAIINRQMHPCSYVRLPEGSRLYKRLNGVKNAADMIGQWVHVHWGVTFYVANGCPVVDDDELPQGRWFGWDYGHFGDYAGYMGMFHANVGGHRWTTRELLDEVYDCIGELETQEARDDVHK